MSKLPLVIIILLILFLCTNLSGCIKESRSINQEYFNEKFGFFINPPNGWIVNESNSSDDYNAVYFHAPTNNITVDLIISKSMKLEENQTLETCIEETIALYNESLSNFSLISRNKKEINDMDAYEIVYSYVKGASCCGEIVYKEKQTLVRKDNKIVMIVYVTLLVYYYDKFISVVDQSIDSFKII